MTVADLRDQLLALPPNAEVWLLTDQGYTQEFGLRMIEEAGADASGEFHENPHEHKRLVAEHGALHPITRTFTAIVIT